MEKKAFKNVVDQIGSCGIWCGSCIAGNGVLQDLTKRYHKAIADYGLEQWAPKNFDFSEFMRGLESIQTMPICSGCQQGGGRDDCEIRECVISQEIKDCNECSHPKGCPHRELLDKMQTGAQEAGLMVKLEPADSAELIKKWSSTLRTDWLTQLLFLDE